MKVFSGKNALVIGGSGGIGAGLSEFLASSGASLTVTGGHDSKKLDDLLVRLSESASQPAKKILYDFTAHSFSEIEKSPVALAAKSTDILCVCWGPFLQKRLEQMTAADWENVSLYDYALPGFFLSIALSGMIERKFGRILLFGGTGLCKRQEFLTNAAYAGAKSGISLLVKSTAAAYAKFGITCNGILPGFTKTEYNSDVDSILAKKMPLGKTLSVKSVAESGFFLLSHEEINGSLLEIDGGWSPMAALNY